MKSINALMGTIILAATAGVTGAAFISLGQSAEERLFEKVSTQGKLNAKDLVDVTWDRVCAVGPYCNGYGTGDFCENFDEDTWGLVFFNQEHVVSVKTFSRRIQYNGPVGPVSCQTLKNSPAFLATGVRQLTLRSTE
jgi:hypothetical protein